MHGRDLLYLISDETPAYSEIMTEQRRFFGVSRGLGPHASRRGLLQAGLAIGTLALSRRAPADICSLRPQPDWKAQEQDWFR